MAGNRARLRRFWRRLRHAAVPWLAAAVHFAALAAAFAARTVAPACRSAATAGARGAARGWRRAVTGLRQLAAVTVPVVRHRVLPHLLLAVVLAAAAASLAASRVAEQGEAWVRLGGIHADRLGAALADALALTLAVWLPSAWRRTRARLAVTAAAARRGGLAAFRATAPHLPGVARGAGAAVAAVAVLAATGLTLLDPALRLAARGVDVDVDGAGFPVLEERSTVVAADGSVLATLHGTVDRRAVGLDRVPEHMRAAVVAVEDREFFSHSGYDVEAIARAAWANVRARRLAQGGSTITQQLAKQNYVGGERTLGRKVSELVHAVALEQAFTKEQLLERYLNQVYFGAGAYGVAAAAEQFFGVEPEGLDVAQAALLAAVIRSPGTFDPRADETAAVRRRGAVLRTMVATGALGPGEAAEAARRPLGLVERRTRVVREPHAVEAVKRELLDNPALGANREQRSQRLLTGGLEISVTLEPDLQRSAAAAAAAHLPAGEGLTAALAAVEPASGRVRALHSGADFADSQFDVATQGRRQPGSAFKPFVVAAAMEHGVDPARELDAAARAYIDVAGERWVVTNDGGVNHGRLGLGDALAVSANTAFAELALEIGVEAVVDVLDRVGIGADDVLGPEAARGPSIALGGVTHGVSPLQLAAAYGPFVAGGDHAPPYVVERVVDRQGRVVYEAEPRPVPALDAEVAAATADLLRAAVRDGTGRQAWLSGAGVAGKTGTTQHGADAWFVGAVEGLSTAVWVGHPDGRTPVAGLAGGTVAAPIWRHFTSAALADAGEPR